MKFKPYCRPVHYYETDQMSVVHHSNYIRWMEEARLDWMAQAGISYPALEQAGVLIPVVDVNCSYLVSARYGDTVEILPVLTGYTGVRLCFQYEIRRKDDGVLLATAASTHCFEDKSGTPISMKRHDIGLHNFMFSLAAEEEP